MGGNLVELSDLLLEGEDVGDAAVDGVLQACLGLVGDGDGGLAAFGHGEVHEELGDVAGAEDLVDSREVGGALLVAEVGGEDAPPRALPPQELASPAGRPEARHPCRRCESLLLCLLLARFSSSSSGSSSLDLVALALFSSLQLFISLPLVRL